MPQFAGTPREELRPSCLEIAILYGGGCPRTPLVLAYITKLQPVLFTIFISYWIRYCKQSLSFEPIPLPKYIFVQAYLKIMGAEGSAVPCRLPRLFSKLSFNNKNPLIDPY